MRLTLILDLSTLRMNCFFNLSTSFSLQSAPSSSHSIYFFDFRSMFGSRTVGQSSSAYDLRGRRVRGMTSKNRGQVRAIVPLPPTTIRTTRRTSPPSLLPTCPVPVSLTPKAKKRKKPSTYRQKTPHEGNLKCFH